jgi:tetratricopeptide (TPR) repeat protein
MFAFMPLADACINSVGTDHAGRKIAPDWAVGRELTDLMLRQEERTRWLAEPYRTIDKAREHKDFESLTNLGVLLIYQGQYASAVRLFVFLEKHHPGHHETAANLGTALELSGHDAVALQWIRIGIRRDPDEHEGTEWLHARILQAKLEQARNPAYLQSHSVAGIAFEPALVPRIPAAMPAGNTGEPIQPWQLNRALAYQLYERTQFVAPEDPVVANLLLDWATLNLAGGPIENADALYDVAVDYGAPRDALMRQRKAFIKQTLERADSMESISRTCGICRPLSDH